MKINLTKQVKLRNPESGEENFIYTVVNYNEVTNRVYIELVCDLSFKPQELVSIEDVENV
jgi:hypothetical protein